MAENNKKLGQELGIDGKTVVTNMEDSGANFEFLETGLGTLDKELDGGLLKEELVILGGHTGIGKTYIATRFMYNIARQGYKTAYFSLEMSNEFIVARMIGALSNVKPIRVRMGTMDADELVRKNVAKAEFLNYAEYMYYYDQVYALDLLVQEIKKNEYDFVVVDFIQNIIGGSPDEYSRLSNAALTLQKTAKEAECCILILSQLSNAAAKEGGTQVLEYKGSGSIATVCDLGFVIKKADFNETTNTLDRVDLVLRKNRRGKNNLTFHLLFQQPGGWIEEVTLQHAPPIGKETHEESSEK